METPTLGLLQIFVLAIIQGVSEFLPISSSAHLILPAKLVDWPDQGLAFDVAVHLGTLAAAMIYFRRDLAAFGNSVGVLFAQHRRDANLDLLLRIALATMPIVVCGALFSDEIEAHLRNTASIALVTMAFGLALWWADRRHVAERSSTPTSTQALLIGLAQAVALVPGTSRAGITITAALALGLARRAALQFSFLLAIPTIAAASLFMAWSAKTALPWPTLGIGFAIAMLCAWLCIAAFMRLVERIGMAPFAVYRLALGAVLLIFF